MKIDLDKLYRTNHETFKRMVSRVKQIRFEEREDYIQDFYLSLYDKEIQDLNDKELFSYMNRSFRNFMFRSLRRNNKLKHRELEAAEIFYSNSFDEFNDNFEAIEMGYELEDAKLDILHQEIRDLPTIQRDIMYMYLIQKLTDAEIAIASDRTVVQIQKRRSVAIESLKRRLKAHSLEFDAIKDLYI